MQNVTLTHREFIGACEELAKRTGRPLGDVAAGLAANVSVQAPPVDPSRFRYRDFCSDAARLTAELGISISTALAQLKPEDYFDGAR